jgi:hypothetical protein
MCSGGIGAPTERKAEVNRTEPQEHRPAPPRRISRRRRLPFPPTPFPRSAAGGFPPGAPAHLATFMRQRPERLRSRERDFGLRWRDGATLHRVAWIEDTGELYAVQLGPPSAGGGNVEVLADGARDDEVAAVLRGWRTMIDRPDSIRWLRERVRSLPRRRRDATGGRASALPAT